MAGQGAQPLDLRDALSALRYGEEAVDPGLEERLQSTLDPAPAAALVDSLEQLRRALQAHDPRSARRGVGLVGRLLGRDVQAESDALALRGRMGTLVAAADRSALALEQRARARALLEVELATSIGTLHATVANARAWLEAGASGSANAGDAIDPGRAATRASLERRLGQLATVQATRELSARQLALLQAQDLELLARYRRIRDVLLPAWRQQALAEAGSRGRDHADASARAWAAIESEVDAMAGRLE